MDALIVLLLLIFLILIIRANSNISDVRNEQKRFFAEVKKQISEQALSKSGFIQERKPIIQKSPEPEIRQEIKPVIPEPEIPAPVEEIKPVELPPVIKKEEVFEHAFTSTREEYKTPEVKPAGKSFLEKNPDLEKFIGENLVSKIGIAILVLGIGFFVKYAIDMEWINEIGRVSIGILAGGILTGFAHWLRKDYKNFSSILVGGGLAVFYFSISIAFHQYQLLSQTAAFVIMVLITGFATVLSIAYDRQELAVLAIIGGFTAPFLVSTGEGNYIVLFTYLLILNLGMLVLAYFRKWTIVNIVCYGFTILLFGGWFTTKVIDTDNPPYLGAFSFATIFYLVFFLMNIINNIREKRSFAAIDFSLLLSNTFLYYSVGMTILNEIQLKEMQGLYTAILGLFNLLFAFVLFRNSKADRSLVYLLIGLVLTFLSLAAPVQLEGNWITMFWALEAVLLLWLAQKLGIGLLKIGSVVMNVLVVASLVMDWKQLYIFESEGFLPLLINKGFITGLLSVLTMFLSVQLLKGEKEEDFIKGMVPLNSYRQVLNTGLWLLLYFTLLLELNHQLNQSGLFSPAILTLQGIYHFIWLAGLLIAINRYNAAGFKIPGIILGVVSAVLFMAFYNGVFIDFRDRYLETMPVLFFTSQLTIVLLLLLILYLTLKNTREAYSETASEFKFIQWFSAFAVVFVASAELDHILVTGFGVKGIYETILHQSHKIGYPILWGVLGFVFMFFGISRKDKQLRIISLSLFLVILLKLFLFDFREMSEGGKILSFIILGVILLVISFMYQKVKKLIMDEEGREGGINN
jgi:uncharacterized membrane protein